MRSARVKPAGLSVIAAFFGERPERAWIAELQACDATFSLTFVETRVALISRARSIQPSIVVLPLRDDGAVSTAPLIARLRENAPGARILVVLLPGDSREGLAEAIRAGAEAAVLAAQPDLRSVLFRTDQRMGLSVREHEAARALLGGVEPAELRAAIAFCVTYAHERLSVGQLSMWQGLSARAFGRKASVAHWPSPTELIGWGSILRASLMEWSASSNLPALARASGFASARALQRTAERLLQRQIDDASDLAPLLVTSRLQRRVQRLEREKA